jgi:EAL domain-containing protein (putative c-di-GMP-specific phosphodiesterase class I)
VIYALFIFSWCHAAAQLPGQRNPVDPDPLFPKRLLIVDDERTQRIIIVHMVAPLGFAVDCAANLAEATAYLREYRYDAVILDLSLGDTEGISLLPALRDCASDPVVIFLSHLDGRVLAASLRLASTMGPRVAGMLRKPASPCALRALPRDAALRQLEVPGAGDPPSVPELAQAIQSGNILPRFQPKISLLDGRIVGMEVLARWPEDADNRAPPDTFVPLAERSGLIVPLTFSIIRASLAACGRWRERHPDRGVAVNISPLVPADPTLPDEIDRLLAETGLGSGALIAEITESTVITNPIMAAETLTRPRIKGIELSIDDFGAGHSSLLALPRPNLLRDAGCDVGQGWYYGHAMPEAELIE